jgi:hypothetical protein
MTLQPGTEAPSATSTASDPALLDSDDKQQSRNARTTLPLLVPCGVCRAGTETRAVMRVRKRASAVAEVRPPPWTKGRSILSRLGGGTMVEAGPVANSPGRRSGSTPTRDQRDEATHY